MTQKFYVHGPWSERSERAAMLNSIAWAAACVSIRLYRQAVGASVLPPAAEAFYAGKCKSEALDLVAALYKDRITISLLDRWQLLEMMQDESRKIRKLVGTPCPLKRGGPCTHCTQATGCLRRPGDDHIS